MKELKAEECGAASGAGLQSDAAWALSREFERIWAELMYALGSQVQPWQEP
jgi:hypothetical protein